MENNSYINSELVKFLKFSLIGFSNTLINYIVFYFSFKIFGIYYLWSSILGYLCGLGNSYFWNTKWTFDTKHTRYKLIKFIIVNIFALSINLFILKFLVNNLKIYEMIAQAFAILGALLINFIGNRIWTFK